MSADEVLNPNPPDGFVPFPFSDGFADLVGPIFYAERGDASALGFRVAPHHCNPAGICHGGMMMTVMDMAIGTAIARVAGESSFTPSVNLTYDFVAPGYAGDWLESSVEWVHNTYKTGFANGFLTGPKGPVLRANGICKIVRGEHKTFEMKSGKKFDFPPKNT